MKKSLRAKSSSRCLAIAAGLVTFNQAFSLMPAIAQDYGDYQPIQNNQFFGNSEQTPELQLFMGEVAMKRKNFAEAERMIRASLDANDDDIDSHKNLALILEEKLKHQVDKDPDILDECVREWIIVMRNERGPEKGLNAKNGLGSPLSGRYSDEDTQLLAKYHLKKLVGRPPKNNETDTKYFAAVLQPAEERVQGKVLKRKPTSRPRTASTDEFLTQ